MTPAELADRFPRLYHVTEPGAAASVRRLGLLTARDACALFEVGAHETRRLTERRRPDPVPITHPDHGRLVINDNRPLSEVALAKCLDDGLTPADWLRILNGMVFFWPDADGVRSLLNARINRDRARDVLVFDTASLAAAHRDAVHLSPINSGSTIRKPARRGLATFSRAIDHDYRDWRRLRGGSDRVREIAVRGSVRDAGDHLVEVLDGAAFR